jgi:hypothetical protein
MTREQVIELSLGLAIPVLLAPFVILGLRRLFAIFLTQGIELFSPLTLGDEDIQTLGSLMAKLNVIVMLFAWLILFTCEHFDVHFYLVTGIGLAGLAGALLITVMVVKSNLELEGLPLWMVALLAFTGGNLPIIVIAGVLLAVLPKILS